MELNSQSTRCGRRKSRWLFSLPVADRVRGFASFTGYPVPAKLMEALPKLEIIATMSVGTDHIDLAAAKARGIAVTNAPDVLTDCVADLGMGSPSISRATSSPRIVSSAPAIGPKAYFHLRRSSAARRWGSSASAESARRWRSAPRLSVCASSITAGAACPTLTYPFYDDLIAMARDSDYLMLTCPGGEATRHIDRCQGDRGARARGHAGQYRARLGGRPAGTDCGTAIAGSWAARRSMSMPMSRACPKP